MPLPPDLKRLLGEHNISETNPEQRIAERGMHMMHSYIELVFLRLQSVEPPPRDPEADARLQMLLSTLQNNVRADVPARV
jgi:hypothetical protein